MRDNRNDTARRVLLLAGSLLLAAALATCGKGGTETAVAPQVDTRPVTPPPAEQPAEPRPAPQPAAVGTPLPPNPDAPLDVPDPSGN